MLAHRAHRTHRGLVHESIALFGNLCHLRAQLLHRRNGGAGREKALLQLMASILWVVGWFVHSFVGAIDATEISKEVEAHAYWSRCVRSRSYLEGSGFALVFVELLPKGTELLA